MALTSGPGAGVGRRGQRHGKGIAQQRPGTGSGVVSHIPRAEPGATAQTTSLAKGVGREKEGCNLLASAESEEPSGDGGTSGMWVGHGCVYGSEA